MYFLLNGISIRVHVGQTSFWHQEWITRKKRLRNTALEYSTGKDGGIFEKNTVTSKKLLL